MKKASFIYWHNYSPNFKDNSKRKLLLSFFFVCVFSISGFSQIFLQLEEKNNPKTKKFFPPQNLIFKLKAYPEDWRMQKMFEILPQENVVIFDENFFKPDEISMIQLRRPWTKALGYKLMQFSAVYYVYGGAATLVPNEYTMSKKEIAIGGAVATSGFLLKTLFYKRNIKLGKNFNLRIVDLRFSTN